MAKPSILIVPGSFAPASLYDGLMSVVADHGYEIKALHLPSVGIGPGLGREGPLPSMYDDAAFIAKEIEKLADDGKEVVAIAHSYGGHPLSESVKGLGKEERQKLGKGGGVVRLAYISCLVPAVGRSPFDLLDGIPSENRDELLLDENNWLYHSNFPKSASHSFSDLSPEEGLDWVKRFAKHSPVSFTNPSTYPGYKYLSVSFLLCEDDVTIPATLQRDIIGMIEKESGNKVDVTSINAGHCPMASQLQKVVDWILDAARKT